MKKENIDFLLKILLPTIAFALLLYAVLIEPTKYSRYDVNRDGKVNSADLLCLKKYLINKGEQFMRTIMLDKEYLEEIKKTYV